jgi:hypothetical protein
MAHRRRRQKVFDAGGRMRRHGPGPTLRRPPSGNRPRAWPSSTCARASPRPRRGTWDRPPCPCRLLWRGRRPSPSRPRRRSGTRASHSGSAPRRCRRRLSTAMNAARRVIRPRFRRWAWDPPVGGHTQPAPCGSTESAALRRASPSRSHAMGDAWLAPHSCWRAEVASARSRWGMLRVLVAHGVQADFVVGGVGRRHQRRYYAARPDEGRRRRVGARVERAPLGRRFPFSPPAASSDSSAGRMA